MSSYGVEVVRRRLKIWWEGDQRWYSGVVAQFGIVNSHHLLHYDDGEVKWHDLAHEEHHGQLKWIDVVAPAQRRRPRTDDDVETNCVSGGQGKGGRHKSVSASQKSNTRSKRTRAALSGPSTKVSGPITATAAGAGESDTVGEAAGGALCALRPLLASARARAVWRDSMKRGGCDEHASSTFWPLLGGGGCAHSIGLALGRLAGELLAACGAEAGDEAVGLLSAAEAQIRETQCGQLGALIAAVHALDHAPPAAAVEVLWQRALDPAAPPLETAAAIAALRSGSRPLTDPSLVVRSHRAATTGTARAVACPFVAYGGAIESLARLIACAESAPDAALRARPLLTLAAHALQATIAAEMRKAGSAFAAGEGCKDEMGTDEWPQRCAASLAALADALASILPEVRRTAAAALDLAYISGGDGGTRVVEGVAAAWAQLGGQEGGGEARRRLLDALARSRVELSALTHLIDTCLVPHVRRGAQPRKGADVVTGLRELATYLQPPGTPVRSSGTSDYASLLLVQSCLARAGLALPESDGDALEAAAAACQSLAPLCEQHGDLASATGLRIAASAFSARIGTD